MLLHLRQHHLGIPLTEKKLEKDQAPESVMNLREQDEAPHRGGDLLRTDRISRDASGELEYFKVAELPCVDQNVDAHNESKEI